MLFLPAEYPFSSFFNIGRKPVLGCSQIKTALKRTDMGKKTWVQHIGDDPLIYGMPKHMVGISTKDSLAKWQQAQNEGGGPKQPEQSDVEGKYYWTIHPKPNACDKCKALAGKKFLKEPERTHPNCKCEIKKHPLRRPTRYINGSITGHEWLRFEGGKNITIHLTGVWGGITTGVWIEVNGESQETVACPPRTVHTINFTGDGNPPIIWTIRFLAIGSDNVQVDYTIVYEDWSDK